MNKKEYNNEMEIDLIALFHALLRKWWLIAICAVTGAAIAITVTSLLITPQYESKAMLYVLDKTASVLSMADIQLRSELSGDFEVIAKSKPVIDGAIEKMKENEGRTFTRGQIYGMLSVSKQSSTRILEIKTISEDPQEACIVANVVAEQIATEIGNIMKSDPPSIIEKAEVASAPISPNLMKNTAKGFLLGALFVCAILVIQFLMNDNIQSEEDVEKYLGLTTLVSIPYVKKKDRKKQAAKEAKEDLNG